MSGIFDRWLVGSLFSRILFRIYIRDYSYIYICILNNYGKDIYT